MPQARDLTEKPQDVGDWAPSGVPYEERTHSASLSLRGWLSVGPVEQTAVAQLESSIAALTASVSSNTDAATEAQTDAENALNYAQSLSPIWSAGNTNVRVTSIIDGVSVSLAIRDGGDTTINPNSSNGPVNWKIEFMGILKFDETLAPYYAIGQWVRHNGRIYEMLQSYSQVPERGTNVYWRDVLFDADIGNEPIDPTDTDGTLSTLPFIRLDASSYTDSTPGSTGQYFERTSSVTGAGGGGVALVVGTEANVQNGAHIVLTDFGADSTADRKVWIRYKALNVGNQFGACSHGTGTLGVITAQTTGWEWAELSTVHEIYDASFRLYGLNDGMAIDTIILTDLTNTAVPTGVDGFYLDETAETPQPSPNDPVLAALTAPLQDDVLTSTSVTFTWAANDSNVQEWYLRVGDTEGGEEYENFRFTDPAVLSRAVTGLPNDGRIVHIQHSYKDSNGVWTINNYTVTAFNAAAASSVPELSNPLIGSTFTENTVRIDFVTNGYAATGYALRLGASAGDDQYYWSGILDSAARSFDLSTATLPTNGSTIHAEFAYKQPDGTWIERQYTYTARTVAGTTVFTTGTAVRPDMTGATIIDMHPGYALTGWRAPEFDLDGHIHRYDASPTEKVIVRMRSDASGPIEYPIFVNNALHVEWVGLDMVTKTEPGSGIGETWNTLSSQYVPTPNTNPRVALGKMIYDRCYGVSFLHGINCDIAGHECDFYVPRHGDGQSAADVMANKVIYILNSNVRGYISMDKQIQPDGNLADGVHGDFIHNQYGGIGHLHLENLDMAAQGNYVTILRVTSDTDHSDVTRPSVFFKNLYFSRDARYFDRIRSNGHAWTVYNMASDPDYENIWWSTNMNSKQGLFARRDTGQETWVFGTDDADPETNLGTPPNGGFATLDSVGFNYSSPY